MGSLPWLPAWRSRRPPRIWSILRLAGLPLPGDLGGSDGTDEGAESRDRPNVTCPECGTENDPEFTYCRDCVAELPGSDLFEAVDDAGDGGFL